MLNLAGFTLATKWKLAIKNMHMHMHNFTTRYEHMFVAVLIEKQCVGAWDTVFSAI